MSLAEFRAMTPLDWSLYVDGWNEVHQPQDPKAPSWDAFQELKAKYG